VTETDWPAVTDGTGEDRFVPVKNLKNALKAFEPALVEHDCELTWENASVVAAVRAAGPGQPLTPLATDVILPPFAGITVPVSVNPTVIDFPFEVV